MMNGEMYEAMQKGSSSINIPGILLLNILLIIYPACPARGKKSDDSTCTSHRFFFLSVLSQA